MARRSPATKYARTRLREDLIAVNCFRCGRIMSAPGQVQHPGDPEPLAGRVAGRAYCWRCIAISRQQPWPATNSFSVEIKESRKSDKIKKYWRELFARKKAAGICRSCVLPVCGDNITGVHSNVYCYKHLIANRERTRRALAKSRQLRQERQEAAKQSSPV
jgi:hypothetical protein